MKNSKQLREEIAAAVSRVEAILASASAENRELTADENTVVDGVHGKDGKGGSLAALETELARVEAIEATQARLAAQRPASPAVVPSTTSTTPAARVVPQFNRYRTGSLKAFKGTDAEANAYKAGRFMLATVFNHAPSQQWCRDQNIDTRFKAAMQEGHNELGGFLVPEEMELAIIDLREQYGVFRGNCKVTPMASDTKTVPRRTGGLTAYFGGELETMTESSKSWDQVKLVAKKLYCLAKYSNELNEDALISIGDDLAQEMAYAFSVKEDQCGFVGDGTSTYGGIVGVTNAVAAGSVVTATGNATFSALTLANFESMMGKLPTYVQNPKWYISKPGYAASMQRLLEAAGGNTMLNLSAGAPLRFLGLDVVITQTLATALTGTTGLDACLCGDLAMTATLGDRRGMAIARSDERYFELDEIGIRGTERFDINVHERGTASVAGSMLKLVFG